MKRMKRLTALTSALLSLTIMLSSCGGAAPIEKVDSSGAAESSASVTSDEKSEASEKDTKEPTAVQSADDDTSGMTFKEAPMLEELVASGEIPPVEERLPEEPLISTADEIGKYGGTFRGAGFGPTHGQLDTEGFRFTGLLRLEPDLKTMTPMLLKEYTVNDDFTEWVLTLRKGLKWSDGEPFTSDALMFWYEDILLNEEVTPTVHDRYISGGEVMKMEAVDDETVKVSFAAPYPAFDVVMMNSCGPGEYMWAPRHYLENWHIKYNTEAEALAKEEGQESWVAAFNIHKDRGQTGTDCEAPDISPWLLREIDDQGNRYFHRNPYYFVVDKEGNQLPYIDEQVSVLVADAQTRTLKLMSGELHAAAENPLPVSEYTLYKDGEAQGDYTTYMFENTRGSDCAFTFNITHKDPVLRELFNDVKFREAMSLSIDRQQINEVLFFNRATIRAAVPPPDTSFMDDWMNDYMTEFDPEGAGERFDELGLEWDAAHAQRTRPDGSTLVLVLETTEEFAAMAEMVAEMWTEAGIKTEFKQQERSFMRERFLTNERDVQCFTFDSVAEFALRSNPEKIKPAWVRDELGFAPLYREWYDSDGASGEEPPQELQDFRAAVEEWQLLTPGSDEYIQAGKDILKTHTENLWYVGLTVAPRVVIISNTLGNTPDEGTFAGDYKFWFPFRGDAWYFK